MRREQQFDRVWYYQEMSIWKLWNTMLSEMLFLDEIPPKVSITEAVEIAKIFSSEDSSSFINGIMDAIYNENFNDNN